MRGEFLFAKNPNPMWIYDPETLVFLDVNDAAVYKYKYSRETFLNNTLLLIRDANQIEKLISGVQHAYDKAISETNLWLHRDADGKQFHVNITSLQIEYNGKPARFVQANDVEIFVREQQLNDRLVRRLRKQIVFLRRVAWMQSHQLRARIAHIIGLL